MILFWLSVVCIILAGLYYRYCDANRLICKIPGPRGWPILENVFELNHSSEDIIIYLRNIFNTYKVICKLFAGDLRNIFIYAPEDIETIVSNSRFNEKRKPYTLLKPWLNEGLLTSNGEKWQKRRKLLTPAFHFKILKEFISVFNKQTEELLDAIQQESEKLETDVVPLITNTTITIMTETSMGSNVAKDVQSRDKYLHALHVIGGITLYRLLRPWFYINSVFKFTRNAKLQDECLNQLHGFTRTIINQRKKMRQEKEYSDFEKVSADRKKLTFLDLLLEQEKNGQIDYEGMAEEVDTFMFEGHDTTAMSLCFMLMRIANEPEAQDKIYDEIQYIFGDSKREPTMDDLSNMKYLECCIKESLRLYPGVPIIFRYLAEETVLSGYRIPAHTYCTISIFDIHRTESIYPEPEKFIPERFLPEQSSKRHAYAYIPFSAGPRNCIGQKFAMLEMKTIMSGIIRRFKLEPITKPEDLVFTGDLVLRTNHPLRVRFRQRK